MGLLVEVWLEYQFDRFILYRNFIRPVVFVKTKKGDANVRFARLCRGTRSGIFEFVDVFGDVLTEV